MKRAIKWAGSYYFFPFMALVCVLIGLATLLGDGFWANTWQGWVIAAAGWSNAYLAANRLAANRADREQHNKETFTYTEFKDGESCR